MEATRQKIVVKEVINVAHRNAALRRQVRYQGLPDSELPLVPAETEPYLRKFICVELSHDDAVAEMIADFNREASAYVSSVHERARRDTRVVSFTSGQMRAMLDNFPEVTQMDSTHKPNQ
ncbi:hypothetical protein L915_06457 [Phytophthora nicotianae]|uniref:ZSWIM1/3 RNaseH-like domain-containing protein n=2 Tax=Phytophthora nicotianae TaxID=4792 RepID=W2H2R6_PHYNI|nr:hypothetical protein L915_06457 [Phytophthora nicotianae]